MNKFYSILFRIKDLRATLKYAASQNPVDLRVIRTLTQELGAAEKALQACSCPEKLKIN